MIAEKKEYRLNSDDIKLGHYYQDEKEFNKFGNIYAKVYAVEDGFVEVERFQNGMFDMTAQYSIDRFKRMFQEIDLKYLKENKCREKCKKNCEIIKLLEEFSKEEEYKKSIDNHKSDIKDIILSGVKKTLKNDFKRNPKEYKWTKTPEKETKYDSIRLGEWELDIETDKNPYYVYHFGCEEYVEFIPYKNYKNGSKEYSKRTKIELSKFLEYCKMQLVRLDI